MTSEQDPHHVIDRVTFGASILDEVWPGWDKAIDLDRLDMGHGAQCLGAQLIQSSNDHEGSYYYEFERAFAKLTDVSTNLSKFMDACGFSIYSQADQEDFFTEYGDLDRAWTDEILRRRPAPDHQPSAS